MRLRVLLCAAAGLAAAAVPSASASDVCLTANVTPPLPAHTAAACVTNVNPPNPVLYPGLPIPSICVAGQFCTAPINTVVLGGCTYTPGVSVTVDAGTVVAVPAQTLCVVP